MHNFKELKVWRAGIDISKAVFDLTKTFPPNERYGLTSQMTRAAISIPSNIAEGCGRQSNKELKHFLSIALGSCFELETQLIIATEFNYLSSNTAEHLSKLMNELQKMLTGLQKSLIT